MKKILLTILLFIPIITKAETFKYEDTVYAFEEVKSECVEKDYLPFAITDKNEIIYVHASGDDQLVKLSKEGKCSELTQEDYLKLSSREYYNYELEKNDQGKYIIKKTRADEFAYFVKTKDTDIVEKKQYIVITSDSRATVSEPIKEELNNYYEHILLTKPKKLEINPNITYYKKSNIVDVYEIVESPKVEEIHEYFVEDSYTPEIFDDINMDNLEELNNNSAIDILTNQNEDKFYFIISDNDNSNKKVYDVNGKEIEQFKNSLSLFFLTDELIVASFANKTEFYDKELNIIYTDKNNIFASNFAYSDYSHYLLSLHHEDNTIKTFMLNEHKLLEGKDQVSNNQDLIFRFSGKKEDIEKVLINDKELDSKHYDVESGSTIITLKKDYLTTLENKEYTLKVSYKDEGYSEASFKVENTVTSNIPENPQTGDGIILVVIGVVVSLLGIGIVVMLMKED